jgi:excinuclease ABC subunit A
LLRTCGRRRETPAPVEGESPRRKRRMLYILDEPPPAAFDDVSKLLSAFRRLIEVGGSIVVIEHNRSHQDADWVIDLGPEGGERGGNVVGVGPPEPSQR